MKPAIAIYIVGWWLCFLASFAGASGTHQESAYLSRFWQTDDGLPHNTVQAITQTQDGWLWLGTRHGLARFDGVRFSVLDAALFPKLENRSFTALQQSRDGTFWIGTGGGGLIAWKDQTPHFFNSTNGLPGNNVRTIYETRDGSVWIGTADGLTQFTNGRPCQTWTTAHGLPHAIIRSLSEDDHGLWIATVGGLARMADGKITLPAGTIPRAVNAFVRDAAGGLWLGLNGALAKSDGERFTNYFKKHGLPDNFVSALFSDHAGRLWIGTYGGLCYFSGAKFVPVPLVEETAPQVNCLFADRENNLWVGTKEGLGQLRARPISMLNQSQSLSHQNVTSVLEDNLGRLWAGTWGGGLNVRLEGTNHFTRKKEMGDDLILALHQTRDEAIWLGEDYGRGLYRWYYKDGLTHYGVNEGLEKAAIRVIHQDHENALWIGTSLSLNRFQDGKFSRFTTTNGLAGHLIRVIHEDQQKQLWVGGDGGLSRRAPGENQFSPVAELAGKTVTALRQDAKGDLWIGTDDHGLARYREGRLSFYTRQDGLLADTAFEILEDEKGFLWMSCLNGIYRIDRKQFDDFDLGKMKSLVCTAYDKADGMATSQCNGVAKPSGWKGKNGLLYFATTKGIAVIDPATVTVNPTPPPVVIEKIVVDRHPVWTSAPASSPHGIAPDVSLTPLQTLALKPGQGEVEIHYTALSFTVPEKKRFKYRMQGIDPDWVEAEARQFAYYNQLAPGEYEFQVIAGNNDGVWNPLGAKVKLTLPPHFWQTLWFKILSAFLAIAAVAGTARYVTQRRMQRRLEKLEQQHAIERERARIAQDMHDDLGLRLTEILLASDRAAQVSATSPATRAEVESISRTAREVMGNLDSIVWAVDPQHDSVDSLVDYICEHVPMIFAPTNIRCRLQVLPNPPDWPISSETRHHIFLVVKEALHNAIKHSQATEVILSIDLSGTTLRLSIRDNGQGFPTGSASKFGNGLTNMKKRIGSVGGDLEVRSETGGGTTVKLNIPLHPPEKYH